MSSRLALIGAGFLAWANVASGYLVGPPLSLEKLTSEADVIFKGTAISSRPVQDEWFKPCPGFDSQETEFKVISVMKGDKTSGSIHFRHYDRSPVPQGLDFQPQFYHFTPGRTYIVFAMQTGRAGEFRQLWANHTGKDDQGVLLCSNDHPATSPAVKEVIWNELTAMLKTNGTRDVIYAIRQFDQFSRRGNRDAFDHTGDFAEDEVLTAIHGLMANPDAEIARSAIVVIGSHNPYLSDGGVEGWLATVGSADIRGIGKMDLKMKNPGGEKYWSDLVALADAEAPVETRALAIKALGLVREPSLRKSISRWLADAEPAVRAAATLLLADFPGSDADRQLTALTSDDAPNVRACVAVSIGFLQQTELAGQLGRLLKDKERQVRKMAAMSLLSFSAKISPIAAVFRANLDDAEFQPLFLNSLASENPEPYLDSLAKVVEEKTMPSNWSGGQIPAFTAWKILFKYLQGQAPETVRSGRLDRYLDALELVGDYGSSEPRDIYAFYLQRDMTERAKKFRATAKKRVPYDLDFFFNMVDANPSSFTGN